MREIVKGYVTAEIKKDIETLAQTVPMYEISLDIGISETSLRAFLKGKGLKKSLCEKVEKFVNERNK